MIVDIGPRQSGKTTRLIEAMAQFLEDNPDKTALLVAHNNNQRKDLKVKVENICGDCKHRVITSHKMLPPNPNSTLKQFVDEFGMMENDRLVLDPQAYYCSSYNPYVIQSIESMENYGSKAREIVDYYNWNTSDRWDLGPRKSLFKHEF